MILCPAQPFDLSQIMQIERAAFIPSIQEKERVFDSRLQLFPQGFFVLIDSSVETVKKAGHAVTAGYFCSELWQSIPADNDFFALNHKPQKSHFRNGTVLYVSSIALLPDYQGKGYGKAFFTLIEGKIKERGLHVIYLMTDRNQPAYEFYQKIGFR